MTISPVKILRGIYRRIIDLLLLPIFIQSFFEKETGQEYQIGFIKKLKLLFRIYRNTKRILCASSWHEHVLMVGDILKIPPSTDGVVVECGSFKGASTANLSLACALTGRKLVVFDSFEGLPEPDKTDESHHCPYVNQIHTYSKGAFSGSLEEVKSNIKKYGCLEVCEFVQGYFKETMPAFVKNFNSKIVFIFLDVDLRKSFEVCLIYLWSFLQKEHKLFIHEARHLEISSLFFDKEWWESHFNHSAPGLIGAGSGLSFNVSSLISGSSLGYVVKFPKSYRIVSQDKTLSP